MCKANNLVSLGRATLTSSPGVSSVGYLYGDASPARPLVHGVDTGAVVNVRLTSVVHIVAWQTCSLQQFPGVACRVSVVLQANRGMVVFTRRKCLPTPNSNLHKQKHSSNSEP